MVHKEQMELTILGLIPYFKEVDEGVYASDTVVVTKMNQPIPFEVVKQAEDWSVKWK